MCHPRWTVGVGGVAELVPDELGMAEARSPDSIPPPDPAVPKPAAHTALPHAGWTSVSMVAPKLRDHDHFRHPASCGVKGEVAEQAWFCFSVPGWKTVMVSRTKRFLSSLKCQGSMMKTYAPETLWSPGAGIICSFL